MDLFKWYKLEHAVEEIVEQVNVNYNMEFQFKSFSKFSIYGHWTCFGILDI